MASLSQALRLGDLPPPHRTFQGHATHIIEWSMMLRPNDSWGTCISQGIATFLHYASRRSAGTRYTTRCRLRAPQASGAAAPAHWGDHACSVPPRADAAPGADPGRAEAPVVPPPRA